MVLGSMMGSAAVPTKPELPPVSLRSAYLKALFIGTLASSVLIFTVFSIYWGSVWRTPYHPVSGWIVDFDGGVVGQSVSASLSDLNSGRGGIAWHVVPATQFPQGITQLQRAVVLEKTWYAVAVNAGASSNLSGAISTIDPSYTSASVVTFMGSEARNENLYRLQTHIFIAQLEIVVNQFAVQFIKNISTSNNLPTLLSAAPEIIARPIYYTVDNLRPFDASVATGSTFFGLIYILITAFIVVLIGTAARMSSGLEHRLSFGSLVRLRLGTLFVTFFFITLIYTLLNRAFQLPFDRQFGRAGFLVFWMLNYLNMLACGLALEVMISILTRLTPFFLITWIISNVSVAVWPLQVLPHVYRYGYAFPFYNASRAVRVVVFGTKNEVGLNAGVLIAWIALSCLTLPLVQWVMRRRLAVSNSPARAA
ncbi:hypothetical protein B0H16DRAFT_1530565 [Mycena metata]|uniref:DUF3533 domain-containing protein n=1 Tax=Mycena metata TaxID=1033252 RepID=A0AAD7NHY1_9AGAR|nr:hypothetical protein B0H16DRAFT_1530565 [Mycena metata]